MRERLAINSADLTQRRDGQREQLRLILRTMLIQYVLQLLRNLGERSVSPVAIFVLISGLPTRKEFVVASRHVFDVPS